MSLMVILLLIYGAGAAVILFSSAAIAQGEATRHGQDVLFALGVAIAALWPMALLWYALVALYFATSWTLHRLAEWSRCE